MVFQSSIAPTPRDRYDQAAKLGNPDGDEYGWILGQFALLGRREVVRALLDSGLPVDTRGWSNFTPLDQAAMHGRTQTVQLLIDRGAPTCTTAPSTRTGLPRWTAPSGAYKTTGPRTATTRHRAGTSCCRRPDPSPTAHRRPGRRQVVTNGHPQRAGFPMVSAIDGLTLRRGE